VIDAFIDTMPKAELHVHLEGTLEPDLSFALAQKNGVELPHATPEALLRACDFDDLPSFLAVYYKGMEVLRDEGDFFELTWRYLLKARGGRTRRGDRIDPVFSARSVFVVQDLTASYLRRMLELGMLVTVIFDDPAYFRGYMNENLHALYHEGGLTRQELVRLVHNAFTVAWIDGVRRRGYLERLQRHVDASP
jgi:adenosine deaminase